MSYSDFKLSDVKRRFKLQVVENEALFAQVQATEISRYLQDTFERFTPLALAVNTEKSRSEWIIAPLLAEVRQQLANEISLFSGIKLQVEPKLGLDGYCDYIISRSPEQYYLAAPIITIVEAKKENLVEGLGQCLATMYAARLFNEREKTTVKTIYGAITSGTNWKFLKLAGTLAYIDRDEYYLQNAATIVAILKQMTQVKSQRNAVKKRHARKAA